MSPLEVARASPEAVGRHDREAWLALFTPDALVQDPVGAPGHPRERLEDFWQIFIGPNDIAFEVHQDHVDGAWVYRDVTIHTRFPLGATLAVPVHLRYQIEGDRLRRLHAHWELLGMSLQATLLGPRAWWDSTALSLRMLGRLGLRGTWAYLGALRSVGSAGKRAAREHAAGQGIALGDKVIAAGDWVTARVLREGVEGMACYRLEGGSVVEERVLWEGR